MYNELIEKLSLLELEKKYLKRELDNNYYDREIRKKTFDKIKDIDKKIKNIKFKLQIERKIKNDFGNRSR